MGKYIKCEESPYNAGLYTLTLAHDELPLESTSGSFNLLFARIAGLSYPNFLRMCRDVFDAEVVGRNSLYPIAYFKPGKGLNTLVSWLDARAKWLMQRYNHPYEIEVDEAGAPIRRVYDNGEIEDVHN